jgi:hypothetical protein
MTVDINRSRAVADRAFGGRQLMSVPHDITRIKPAWRRNMMYPQIGSGSGSMGWGHADAIETPRLAGGGVNEEHVQLEHGRPIAKEPRSPGSFV